ncbi:MAG TPA: phytanoyl-CoA dioxygenase family protein [Ilumatobacter sp.]
MRLLPEQFAGWAELGWLLLPGALDDRLLDELRAGVDELRRWAAGDGPGLHHFEQTDAGPALARSELFADDQAVLGAFIRSGVVPGLLEQLFGQPAVLFKEKVNYKAPGGAGFAPHQDATAYRFVEHHISVMVPLDPATSASGCLWFAPGHGRGRLPTEAGNRIAPEVVAQLAWQPVEAHPGDLVVFDSYAPHHSGTNTTDRSRVALYLTYNAASDGDQRATYYADKQAELAAGDGTFGNERVRISVNDDFLGRPVVR